MNRRQRLPLVLVPLLATACSSGGSEAQPATEEGLRQAAREQIETFIDNPTSTYRFLSEECRDRVSRSDWAAQMVFAAGFFSSFFGFELDEAKVGEVQVRNVDGARGEAYVELLGPDGTPVEDQGDWNEFVYEDGSWRSTDCEDFADDSSDGTTDATDAGSPDTTVGGELRPADEVTEENRRAASADGELGTPVDLDGLTLLVSGILLDKEDRGGDDDYVIRVLVRTENRSGEEKSNPEMKVTCTNTADTGSWYSGSTFELYKTLPSGSFDEGELLLGVPQGCEDPVVRAQPFVSFSDDLAVDWPVPVEIQDAG